MFKDPYIKTSYLEKACSYAAKHHPELFESIMQLDFLEKPYRLMDEVRNSLFNIEIFKDWSASQGKLPYSPGAITKYMFKYISPSSLIRCLTDRNNYHFQKFFYDKTLTKAGRKALKERVLQFVERHGIEKCIKSVEKIYSSKDKILLDDFIQRYYESLDLAMLLLYTIHSFSPGWQRASWIALEGTRPEAEIGFLSLGSAIVEDWAERLAV